MKKKSHRGITCVPHNLQGKLEVVKQEMARVNVDILGISRLTQMTTVGRYPLEEME